MRAELKEKKAKREYDAAVAECDALNDAAQAAGSEGARRLAELADLIAAYEDEHEPEPKNAPSV